MARKDPIETNKEKIKSTPMSEFNTKREEAINKKIQKQQQLETEENKQGQQRNWNRVRELRQEVERYSDQAAAIAVTMEWKEQNGDQS